MPRRLDFASLVAGVAIAGFGVVLLLDAGGQLRIQFQALWPMMAFIAGATLFALGLTRRD